MKYTHTHHIIPRHIGGTDDPSNLVELTPQEHADAHHLLWCLHKRDEDRAAWEGLSGIARGGHLLSRIAHANWNNPNYRSKMMETSPSKSRKVSAARRKASPVYSFKHDDGQVVTGRLIEIQESYPYLSRAKLCMVAKGQKPQYKGWRLSNG